MRPSQRTVMGLLLGALITLTQARLAQAFVCSQVLDSSGDPSGASLAWFSRTIPMAINANGTVQLNAATAFPTILKGFSAWQNITLRPGVAPCPTSGTTDIVFQQQPNTSQSFSGYNYLAPKINQNIVVFRDNTWPHAANPPVIALTTTTYNALTGQILDADIELNTAMFQFSDTDTNIDTDLWNTMSHEVGHFLGFAHSLDPNATTYATAPPGEISKRLLACDDAAIMLFRYPAGKSIGYSDGTVEPQSQCVYPGTLQYSPTTKIADQNDSLGGCQCSNGGSASLTEWAVALAGSLLCLGLRRWKIRLVNLMGWVRCRSSRRLADI